MEEWGKHENTVVQLLDFVPSGRRSMDTFLLMLARRLQERGWRTVFVFAGEPSAGFQSELQVLDCPFMVQRLPGPVSAALRLGRALRAYRPSVLQTHFVSKFDRNLLPLRIASGVRHVVVTDRLSGAASRKSFMAAMLSRVRGRLTASYVDHVIAVSEFVRKRDVTDGHFPAGQISVVYNGVDVNRYVPTPRPAAGEFSVAFAGQLIPQKGLPTLIEAVRLLHRGGRKLRVRIAGVGNQEAELKHQCADAGIEQIVTFLGQIDWVPRLFGEADVVVVPSVWEEAFGFVVAEAAACGACLVVSDAGALPEIMGADGRVGRVFRRGDAFGLAEELRWLMDHPQEREEMRRNSRLLAVERFSLDSMVDGYCSVLDRFAC